MWRVKKMEQESGGTWGGFLTFHSMEMESNISKYL
jgi:hypothetical protein